MIKKRVRTGIIGSGKVAHLHAKVLANIPESEFVAICSRDMGKARQFAEQYNVLPYHNIKEMVRKSRLGAVVICTPHPNHAEGTIAAVEAGANVLIEKPMASSLEDCKRMINAARGNKVLLGMVCQRRFYKPAVRIKKAIDEGKIGKPILGTVQMLGWRDEHYYSSDPRRGKWLEEGVA